MEITTPTLVWNEKRLHTRHPVTTQVHIKLKNKPRVLCYAVNLSASGAAIKTKGLGLRVGTDCELTFVIKLESIIKLHKRDATVKYIKNGITGFYMKPFKGNSV